MARVILKYEGNRVRHQCEKCGVIKTALARTFDPQKRCRVCENKEPPNKGRKMVDHTGDTRNGWLITGDDGTLYANARSYSRVWRGVCQICGYERRGTWDSYRVLSCPACRKRNKPEWDGWKQQIGQVYGTRKITKYVSGKGSTAQYGYVCNACGTFGTANLNSLRNYRCHCQVKRGSDREPKEYKPRADRVGEIRGAWKVLSSTGKVRHRKPFWLAECQNCGATKELAWAEMATRECQVCKVKPLSIQEQRIGNIYNRRKVIAYKKGQYTVECQDCGKEVVGDFATITNHGCRCSMHLLR